MTPTVMYCPYCGSIDLTQEGLTERQISFGLWRCVECGRLCRPITYEVALETGVIAEA